MILRNWKLNKYAVPILALIIVLIHLILVNTVQLSKWKGGGFGMYSEVHYYYNDVYVVELKKPIDALAKTDQALSKAIMDAKRVPHKKNLEKIATLASHYTNSDTLTIQVWKPTVSAASSRYGRELLTAHQFVKP